MAKRIRRTRQLTSRCLETEIPTFPNFFGPGATGVVLYVALNAGARPEDVCSYLKISYGAFKSRMQRLRKMGVLVGSRRYVLNSGLPQYEFFHLFVAALARAYNIPGLRNASWRGSNRIKAVTIGSPKDLFGSRRGTRILLLIAAVNESYPYEIAQVLGFSSKGDALQKRLDRFVSDHILKVRVVKRVKCYSLNREMPGSAAFRRYLRCEARDSPDIVIAANNALARRLEIERASTRRERSIFDEMRRESAHSNYHIYGMRKSYPSRRWRLVHGRFNGERWRYRRVMSKSETVNDSRLK